MHIEEIILYFDHRHGNLSAQKWTGAIFSSTLPVPSQPLHSLEVFRIEICELILQNRLKYTADLRHVIPKGREFLTGQDNIRIFRLPKSAQLSQ